MPKPSTTSGPPDSDRIQTVGQLKEWLKGFSDHNWIACRQAEGYVIIEVPRRLE